MERLLWTIVLVVISSRQVIQRALHGTTMGFDEFSCGWPKDLHDHIGRQLQGRSMRVGAIRQRWRLTVLTNKCFVWKHILQPSLTKSGKHRHNQSVPLPKLLLWRFVSENSRVWHVGGASKIGAQMIDNELLFNTCHGVLCSSMSRCCCDGGFRSLRMCSVWDDGENGYRVACLRYGVMMMASRYTVSHIGSWFVRSWSPTSFAVIIIETFEIAMFEAKPALIFTISYVL
jgi:hypothetical protein